MSTTSTNTVGIQRITHPYARYTANGVLNCVICKLAIDSSVWDVHVQAQLHNSRLAQLQKMVQLPQSQRGKQQKEENDMKVISNTASVLGLDDYSSDDGDDGDDGSDGNDGNDGNINVEIGGLKEHFVPVISQQPSNHHLNSNDNNNQPTPLTTNNITPPSVPQSASSDGNLSHCGPLHEGGNDNVDEKGINNGDDNDGVDISTILIPDDWTGDPDDYIEEYLVKLKTLKNMKKNLLENFSVLGTQQNDSKQNKNNDDDDDD